MRVRDVLGREQEEPSEGGMVVIFKQYSKIGDTAQCGMAFGGCGFDTGVLSQDRQLFLECSPVRAGFQRYQITLWFSYLAMLSAYQIVVVVSRLLVHLLGAKMSKSDLLHHV